MVAGRSLCYLSRSLKNPSFRVGVCMRDTARSQKVARRFNRIQEDSKADLPVLPDDILNAVILLLEDIADVARFSMISKHWYKTIHSNSFWSMQPACAHPIFCCLDVKNSNFSWADLPTSSGVNSKVNCSWRHARKLELNFEETAQDIFSHGLLYARMRSGELRVYNPFKASGVKDILDPPKDVMGGGYIVDTAFYSDILTSSYTVILNVRVPPFEASLGQYHLAIYHSSTRKWSLSKSVQGRFFWSSQTCIGDSVYLILHLAEKHAIYKYNYSDDSWSQKTFYTGEIRISHFYLTQSKGKLLLYGQAGTHLYVWIANEMENAYALTLLFSTRLNSSGELCGCWVESFQPVDDLLLVTQDRRFRIYHASSNRLQSLSNCPPGLSHCFISESSSFFIA